MFFIGFGFNKILFIILFISDLAYITTTYFLHIFEWYWLIPPFLLILFFKYFHFMISYKRVNKRFLIASFISVILSMVLEVLVCIYLFKLFMSGNIMKCIPGIVVILLSPITFICKLIMFINLCIMNKFVKWGMDIPVSALDGSFKNKLDNLADRYLPGL